MFDAAQADRLLYNHMIVIDGRVAGTWKRTFKKGAAVIAPALLFPFTAADALAVAEAGDRLGKFLEMPVAYEG